VRREHRLRAAADFARVRQHAQRGWPHPLLVLYVAPNDLDRTRVGITVSRRVGKATVRNRVRRRLREALRLRLDRLQPGHDLVLSARPPSAQANWSDLCHVLDSLLSRARLWQPVPATSTENAHV
jgi:ribonuclease P protein component